MFPSLLFPKDSLTAPPPQNLWEEGEFTHLWRQAGKKYLGWDHIYNVMQVNKGSRFWKGVIALMPKVILN